jgi:lysophospholipase L1-like esterase
MTLRRAATALALIVLAALVPSGAQATSNVPTPLGIMTIGDSLNTGLGSADGCGYRTELARLMQTAGPGGTPVAVTWTGLLNGTGPNDCDIPYGHHGATVADLRNSVNAWLAADTPDVVLIQVGTNDATGSLTNFSYDYQDLLNRILMWSPTVQVIASWVPYSVAPWAGNEVTVNTMIYGAVVAFAPYPAAARLRLVTDNALYTCRWLIDGVHPVDYTPIARWYYQALAGAYGFSPLPLNSYYFGTMAPRPGVERAATDCP